MKRFLTSLCWISLLLSIMLFSSCSKKAPSMDHISGVVKDMDGNPISNVEVKSNGYSVMTDENGFFTLDHVENIGTRYVLKFDKKGYFTLARSGELSSVGLVEVVLVKDNVKGVSTTTSFTAATGKKITVGEMSVDIPKNGIMYEDGTIYTGKVNVSVLYLDPKSPSFQATMPGGDLVAKRENQEEVPLVSYGMVNVVMKDAKGTKLQIKDEMKSKVTFPISDGMLAKAPDQMPLWHYNETTGIWEESGMAVKNGNIYEGEVEHFSWVNLDDPKQFVVLKGKVKDTEGNILPGIRIVVEQVSTYSNEEGEYSVRIPSETDVTVTVRKEDYLNYDNEFSVLVEGQPGNSTYKQDIVLPVMPSISGKLENMCDKSNVVFPIYCRYEKDGNALSTPFTLSGRDGSFSVKLPADAKKVQLCVRMPDEVLTKDIEFQGVNYSIVGSISICQKTLADKESPRITIDGKETAMDLDDLDYTDFDKDKAEIKGSGVKLTIDKYVEDSIFMNGHVSIEKFGFESTSARIEKRKVNNHIRLTIVATGKAKADDGTEKDAVFEGTLTALYLYRGKCDDFSKLCWDQSIPEMRVPISYVWQEYTLGMPVSAFVYPKATDLDFKRLMKMTDNVEPFSFNIGYKNADENTYKKMIALLEKAGYEYKKKENGIVSYEKGDVMIRVAFEKGRYFEFVNGDGSKMPMVVQISTGIMKWVKNLFKKYLGIDWF